MRDRLFGVTFMGCLLWIIIGGSAAAATQDAPFWLWWSVVAAAVTAIGMILWATDCFRYGKRKEQ